MMKNGSLSGPFFYMEIMIGNWDGMKAIESDPFDFCFVFLISLFIMSYPVSMCETSRDYLAHACLVKAEAPTFTFHSQKSRNVA